MFTRMFDVVIAGLKAAEDRADSGDMGSTAVRDTLKVLRLIFIEERESIEDRLREDHRRIEELETMLPRKKQGEDGE